MNDRPSRPYTSEELNDLLHRLRLILCGHPANVALVVAVALLLEVIHTLPIDAVGWLSDAVPMLQREVMRGTAVALSGGVPVCDAGEEKVH